MTPVTHGWNPIPDRIEPIIGWRYWRLGQSSDPHRLRGIYQQHWIWPEVGYYHEADALPTVDNLKGFWLMKFHVDAILHAGTAAGPPCRSIPHPWFYGLAAGWGKVVESSWGYRVQYATVLSAYPVRSTFTWRFTNRGPQPLGFKIWEIPEWWVPLQEEAEQCRLELDGILKNIRLSPSPSRSRSPLLGKNPYQIGNQS